MVPLEDKTKNESLAQNEAHILALLNLSKMAEKGGVYREGFRRKRPM